MIKITDREILETLLTEVTGIKGEVTGIKEKVDTIESDVKEVKTDIQLLKGGQTGIRNEITDRFNEVKASMRNLESDIEHTYHKTAQQELELNRLKRQ